MGGAPKTARTAYGKRARPARRRPAAEGCVLNITAAVWTAGFHWWHSGNKKKRTQNVSEYMLVLALCLVVECQQNVDGIITRLILSHATTSTIVVVATFCHAWSDTMVVI